MGGMQKRVPEKLGGETHAGRNTVRQERAGDTMMILSGSLGFQVDVC